MRTPIITPEDRLADAIDKLEWAALDATLAGDPIFNAEIHACIERHNQRQAVSAAAREAADG